MEELKKILMNELKKMGIQVRPLSDLMGDEEPALIVSLRLEDNPFNTPENRLEPCADCQRSVTLAPSSMDVYNQRIEAKRPVTVKCVQCAHQMMDN